MAKQSRRTTWSGLCLGGPYDGNHQTARHDRFLVAVMPRVDFIEALDASAESRDPVRELRKEDVEYVHRLIAGQGVWVMSIFEFASDGYVMRMLLDGYNRKGVSSAIIMQPPFMR